MQRIKWVNSLEESRKKLSANPYMSVDPAPPSEVKDTEMLKSELLDEELSLFQRYRAMFSLRNRGDEKSVLALAEGKSYNRMSFYGVFTLADTETEAD